MKIAICDDLNQERRILKSYLGRLESEEGIEIDVCEFDGGEALIEYITKTSRPPEIIFLDIYMDGVDGINAMRKIRSAGYDGSVVFCTTSTDHAVESYKLKADGYLVKPYNYDDFIEAIWRCRRHFEKSKKCFRFVSDRIDYELPYQDVLYVETELRCCAVHTKNETVRTYKKISEFEKETSSEPCFIKIGRSYLVNMNHVSKIGVESLLLSNGNEIPLPTRDKKKIVQTLNSYFWSVARGERKL